MSYWDDEATAAKVEKPAEPAVQSQDHNALNASSSVDFTHVANEDQLRNAVAAALKSPEQPVESEILAKCPPQMVASANTVVREEMSKAGRDPNETAAQRDARKQKEAEQIQQMGMGLVASLTGATLLGGAETSPKGIVGASIVKDAKSEHDATTQGNENVMTDATMQTGQTQQEASRTQASSGFGQSVANGVKYIGQKVAQAAHAVADAGHRLFASGVSTDGQPISHERLGQLAPAQTPGMAVSQGRGVG